MFIGLLIIVFRRKANKFKLKIAIDNPSIFGDNIVKEEFFGFIHTYHPRLSFTQRM